MNRRMSIAGALADLELLGALMAIRCFGETALRKEVHGRLHWSVRSVSRGWSGKDQGMNKMCIAGCVGYLMLLGALRAIRYFGKN